MENRNDETKALTKTERDLMLIEEFKNLRDQFDLVVYHKNCHDGIAAYAVVRKYYKDKLDKDIEGSPCAYEFDFPDFTGKTVLLVDFSFKLPQMEVLRTTSKNYFVLDHHASAEKELDSFPHCFFDMKRSGAMIAWNFFFPGEKAPPLIDYVQDKDLYTWKLEGSRDFNVSMETLSFEPVLWDSLLANSDVVAPMVEKGKVFGEYKNFLVERLASHASSFHWQPSVADRPLKASVANISLFVNEVGEKLYSSDECDVVIMWHYDLKKGSYRFFLRSKLVDTSVIASSFGGGGHPEASGFYWRESFDKFVETTNLKPVVQIMETDLS